MKRIEIESLNDLYKIEEKEFIINIKKLKSCDSKAAIYFLAGLVHKRGSLKKLKCAEYQVTLND